jgi:2-polyprenyl-3-methyl-5-hydroxy-6-metoxy-1,4-benzoquinol methylase
VQEPVSHELLTHYDRFVPAESDPAKKLGYLVRNIVPLIRDLGPDDAILEVGPGRGELMELMRGRGFVNLSAHECCAAFAQDLRDQRSSRRLATKCSCYLKEQGANSFQAILLIDVLEHMSVPDGVAFVVVQSIARGCSSRGFWVCAFFNEGLRCDASPGADTQCHLCWRKALGP